MKTWTPLWSTIVSSTIWSESKDVRLLWITMLAIKDQNGMVESSAIGLSRLASLTYEETLEALKVLESPDTKSDSFQEHEGRRIKRVDGGWIVLNHLKYREAMSKLKHREQQKEWQREYRRKKKEKPLPGQLAHEQMVENGASEDELNRHLDSFND